MLRVSGRAPLPALAAVLAIGALALGLGAVTLLGSADASSVTHAGPRVARVGATLPAAGTLGQAVADNALGLRTAYYEPPSSPDPAAPGTTIISGADQPDPFMATEGGRDYLFTSQDRVPANVPVRSGTIIGQWGPMTDALPDLPAWAEAGNTWAPDVHRFGSHYILYFTAEVKFPGHQIECIGDAISTRIDGPYIAAATPFICQLGQGGSIDPRTFVDADGTPYLLWKSDENSFSTAPTGIYAQRLSANGERLEGPATRIFGPDEPWQGTIVEAPDLVLVRGVYQLFYSGNWFNQAGYAIGVARCAGPLGPCADTSSTPLLSSNAQGSGPGEASVFANAQGVWLLYTPFRSTLPLPGPPRPVAMARLGFGPSGPYLAAPQSVTTASTS
jgi:glycosyl hydrolase family 43